MRKGVHGIRVATVIVFPNPAGDRGDPEPRGLDAAVFPAVPGSSRIRDPDGGVRGQAWLLIVVSFGW